MTSDTPELDPALVEVAARAMLRQLLTREADEIEWYLAHVNTPGPRFVDEQYRLDSARAKRFHEAKPDNEWGGKMGGYVEFVFTLAYLRKLADNLDPAVLPSLRAQVAAEVLGPVLALADECTQAAREKDFPDSLGATLRALVTDPDAVTRHEAGVRADERERVAAAIDREGKFRWNQGNRITAMVYADASRIARADEVTR